MKYFTRFFSVLSFLLIAASFMFAQNSNSKLIASGKSHSQILNNNPNNKTINEIEKEITRIRHKDKISSREKLISLQNRLLQLQHKQSSFSKIFGANILGYQQSQPDFIEKVASNNKSLIWHGNINIMGIATATQYQGTHAGRVWIEFDTRTNNTDSLFIYYSDDLKSWHPYYANVLGAEFLPDQIDMTIVEPTTGDSYIWTTFGVYDNNHDACALFVIDANHPQLSDGVILSWPGAGASDGYYNPRVTTDNSKYPNLAHVFLVCSVDSIVNGSRHFNAQKIATIGNPYTPYIDSCQLAFDPNILPVYWPVGGDLYSRILYSDVAYFYQSSDKSDHLMITYSNIPDTTHIWLTNYTVKGMGGTAVTAGTLGDGSRGFLNAQVASPGINAQIMVMGWSIDGNSANFKHTFLTAYKTEDGGANWTSYDVDTKNHSDSLVIVGLNITAKRGVPDTYYATAYTDSVFLNYGNIVFYYYSSIVSSGNNWNKPVAIKSGSNVLYGSIKPGVQNNGSSDGLAVWFWNDGKDSLWATSNLGPVTSVESSIHVVKDFSLSQNYPNPFNPSTEINYSIPKPGIVKLTVYNSLGQKLAVLVNKYQQGGKHSINFNAKNLASGIYFYRLQSGSFIQAKKMILLK